MANNRRRRQKLAAKPKPNWSDLPYDVLEVISKKLHYIDQLNSRVVCKSWSTVIGVLSLKEKMPWLLVFNDDEGEDEYSCKLINPHYRKRYNIDINILKEKNLVNIQVHESKCGWLLFSSSQTNVGHPSISKEYPSSTSLYLFTPFLTHNNFIELPPTIDPFSIATFSSNPSKEDFVVVTMHSVPGTCVINTFYLGDKSWGTGRFPCEFPLIHVKSLVYTDGVFFCSSLFGKIGLFNPVQKCWVVLPIPASPPAGFLTLNTIYLHNEILDVYLMKTDCDKEVDEEVFLVYLKNIPCRWGRLLICAFKLDRSSMNWKRVENIGNKVMFLGSGCTSFVRVAKTDKVANKIYYIWGKNLKHCTVSMGDRSYPCTKTYGSLSRQISKKVWIEPPPQIG